MATTWTSRFPGNTLVVKIPRSWEAPLSLNDFIISPMTTQSVIDNNIPRQPRSRKQRHWASCWAARVDCTPSEQLSSPHLKTLISYFLFVPRGSPEESPEERHGPCGLLHWAPNSPSAQHKLTAESHVAPTSTHLYISSRTFEGADHIFSPHIWVSIGQQCPSPEPRSLRFLPNTTSFAARGFAPIQLSNQNEGRTAPSMLVLPPLIDEDRSFGCNVCCADSCHAPTEASHGASAANELYTPVLFLIDRDLQSKRYGRSISCYAIGFLEPDNVQATQALLHIFCLHQRHWRKVL